MFTNTFYQSLIINSYDVLLGVVILLYDINYKFYDLCKTIMETEHHDIKIIKMLIIIP